MHLSKRGMIMKKLLLLLIVLGFISCKEDINKTVPYEDSVMLLGKIDKNGFMQEPFSSWFNPEYDNYQINDSIAKAIKPLIKDVEITTFMGTWCSDSQRETPHFLKILESVDFDLDNLTLIAVNDEKTTPQQFEKDLNITNVPTFIFYKDGKELNRIVEFPLESLEQDMLSILKGENYKHAYAE